MNLRTKFQMILIFVFFLLSLSGVAQIKSYLPQMANGGGYKTTYVFFNTGDRKNIGTLSFFRSNGQPLFVNLGGMGSKASHVVDLEPGQTRFFQTDGQGELTIGHAIYNTTRAIGVSAFFSYYNPTLKTESGVGASDLYSEAAVPVDNMNGYHTGVAIGLPPRSGGDFEFKLYDENGSLLGTTTRNFEINGHLAVFVDGAGGLFPAEGENVKGKLVIRGLLGEGFDQFSAVALRQGPSLLTTMPSVPTISTQTEFALPQIADGTFGATGYRTQVILFNLKSESTNYTVSFTDNDGNPLVVKLTDGEEGSSFTRSLEGHGSEVLETDASGSLKIGAAKVVSEEPIGVTAVFSEMKDGVVVTEAGVGASEGATQTTIPFDQTGGFGTGVALLNLGNGPATVNFTVFDEEGNEQLLAGNREALQLPVLGHDAKFVNEIAPGTEGQGQLAIVSDQPLATMVIRQGSGIITTLPSTEGVFKPGGGSSTNLIPTHVEDVELQADTTLDQTMKSGYKLSGKVSLPSGYFPTGTIEATDSVGNTFLGFVNFLFGDYSMTVPPGTYNLRVCGVTGVDFSGGSIEFNSVMFLSHSESQVSVLSDTTRNIQVEEVESERIAGTVDNLEEIGTEGTGLGLFVAFSSDESPTQGLSRIAQDGSYETTVGPGDYTASIFYADGIDENDDGIPEIFTSSGSLYNIGSAGVSATEAMDVTANLTVPDLVNLNGTVSQEGVQTLPDGSAAFALDATFPFESALVQCYPQFGASFAPVQDGQYGMKIISGRDHDVSATVPVTEIGTDNQGQMSAPLPGSNTRSYTDQDSVQDLEIPENAETVVLSGRVETVNGAAVSGVTVTVSTIGGVNGAPDAIYTASTVTGETGRYSITVPKGYNYRIDFDPPVDTDSGFPF